AVADEPGLPPKARRRSGRTGLGGLLELVRLIVARSTGRGGRTVVEQVAELHDAPPRPRRDRAGRWPRLGRGPGRRKDRRYLARQGSARQGRRRPDRRGDGLAALDRDPGPR